MYTIIQNTHVIHLLRKCISLKRIIINYYYFALFYFLIAQLHTYFVPRASEIIKVKYYVWNGKAYDGDSETANELARHTALNRCIATEIR